MRVLVTGGTGFLGSHLVETLLEKKAEVACLVRSTSNLRWIEGLPVERVPGSLEDPESLRRAVAGVEVVIHAAGVTKAISSVSYDRFNHQGTRNLLDACVRNGSSLKRFVYVSSLAAAGPSSTRVPRKEIDPPAPVSLYGLSKLRGEEAALSYGSLFPVTVVRPPALFGPRDSDLFELIKRIGGGIFATFGKGERLIDLCYVTDAVRGILLAAEQPNAVGQVFFIGSGQSYSWEMVAHLVAAQLGTTLKMISLPASAASVYALACDVRAYFTGRPFIISRHKLPELRQRYWICDIGKAREILNYRPATPLEQGLNLTVQWYRNQGWI